MKNLPKSIPTKYANRIEFYSKETKNVSGLPHMVILKEEWHFADTNSAPRVEYFATVKEMLAALRSTISAPVADVVAVASYANVERAPQAYRDMPLSDVLARQRERLFARMTSYTERGAYSALVYKDVGLRGPFWYITVRKGSQVLSNDIHYAGPDHAAQRAEEMLCKVAGPAPRVSLAKPEAPECACILADVPQESNAAVMDRAVAVVRNARLTREYLAAHDDTGPEWEFFGYAMRDGATWSVWRYADGPRFVYQVTESEDAPTGDGGYYELLGVLKLRQLTMCAAFPGSEVACEMTRALAAEQARADAARKLAGGI